MLTDSDLVAFVGSTDLARSRAFYSDVLGLRCTDENPYACVFDSNGTMLRVTAVAELPPVPQTVLGWHVGEIAVSIDALVSRGVTFMRPDGIDQDDRGIWTTPSGEQVAWFTDPDGNTLSLTQFSGA